jgi:adenylate cyclase class 2
MLGDAEIVIDTWPFMEPFVEVEAPSESRLKAASLAAGFDWSAASFFATNKIFQMKYGENTHMSDIPILTFEMSNPFQ